MFQLLKVVWNELEEFLEDERQLYDGLPDVIDVLKCKIDKKTRVYSERGD